MLVGVRQLLLPLTLLLQPDRLGKLGVEAVICVGTALGDDADQVDTVVHQRVQPKHPGRRVDLVFLHHVVHVESVVGDQETLQAGHVVVLGVPGDEDGAGGDVADVEGGDGGQRTQLLVLRCQQVTMGQRFWLCALGPHLWNGKLVK